MIAVNAMSAKDRLRFGVLLMISVSLLVSLVWLLLERLEQARHATRSGIGAAQVLRPGMTIPLPYVLAASKSVKWVFFADACSSCTVQVEAISTILGAEHDRALYVFGEPDVVVRRFIGQSAEISYVSQESSGKLGDLWSSMSGFEAVQIDVNGSIVDCRQPGESLQSFLKRGQRS